MHMMGAIEEEDKLDADEAKKVLRRAGRMALPFKKTIAGALAFTALSTLGIVMGPVILRWGIDQGIEPGDKTVLRNAVLVFFGDPESAGEAEDAIRCVDMALRMQAKVQELQSYWRQNGIPNEIRVRMGVTTGY